MFDLWGTRRERTVTPGEKNFYFRMAKGKCEYCGKDLIGQGIVPEVHHIVPFASRGSDNGHNLIVLCPDCHSKVETIPRDELRSKIVYRLTGAWREKILAKVAETKPVEAKPVSKKEVAKKPVVRKAVVKKPVAKKPVAKKPVKKKTATVKKVTSKAATAKTTKKKTSSSATKTKKAPSVKSATKKVTPRAKKSTTTSKAKITKR